jgi:dihydrofolate reductase
MGAVRGRRTRYRRRCSPYQIAGCPDLLLWGNSTLTSTVLEHELADEVALIVYPVMLGTGKRFFAQDTSPRSFKFVSANPMPSGAIICTYKVGGPLKTG